MIREFEHIGGEPHLIGKLHWADVRIGDRILTEYYENEIFVVTGIKRTELHLRGDWSGGTHCVDQESWYPIEQCKKIYTDMPRGRPMQDGKRSVDRDSQHQEKKRADSVKTTQHSQERKNYEGKVSTEPDPRKGIKINHNIEKL